MIEKFKNWLRVASAPQQADVTCDSIVWSCSLGVFCAVFTVEGDNCIKTSPDGIFWTSCDTPGGKNLRWTSVSVVEVTGCAVTAFCVTNDTDAWALVSLDGINWTLYCD